MALLYGCQLGELFGETTARSLGGPLERLAARSKAGVSITLDWNHLFSSGQLQLARLELFGRVAAASWMARATLEPLILILIVVVVVVFVEPRALLSGLQKPDARSAGNYASSIIHLDELAHRRLSTTTPSFYR